MAAPKLRFKEFDKAFSRNTIKELAKIYVGRDLVEDAYSPIKTETHIYPIYSNSVDNEGLYGYYNFEEFNFDDDALTVVGRGAGLGKAFYRQGGFGTIGRLLSLTPKDKSFHPKYLSDYINDKLIIHNESGGIPQLPRSSLESYEVVLPSYEEQTKIASFLSTVDEKISQLTQKHELLSQYKQGMMQKLFSQQIRFKADDGSEFGEWENSYIGNECKITTGNKDTQNKVDDGLYPFFVRSQTVEKINSYSMDCEAILTSGDGVGVGKNYHYINGKFDFHQRVYCLYEFSERLIGKYLYIYFSNYFYDRVKRLSAKNSVDSVRMDMISKMEIKLPCLEEQTKIANLLSAIDQKIEVVAQQIEQAKTWKKGLLQQMFV